MNAALHFPIVPSIDMMATAAENEAMARFPDISQHNTAADAYRHFIWNAAMTRAYGSRIAESFADAHEVSGTWNSAAEHAMDAFNNAVGRAMAADRRFSVLSPRALAEMAFQHGCLQTSLD